MLQTSHGIDDSPNEFFVCARVGKVHPALEAHRKALPLYTYSQRAFPITQRAHMGNILPLPEWADCLY